jgi:hypothetical protein
VFTVQVRAVLARIVSLVGEHLRPFQNLGKGYEAIDYRTDETRYGLPIPLFSPEDRACVRERPIKPVVVEITVPVGRDSFPAVGHLLRVAQRIPLRPCSEPEDLSSTADSRDRLELLPWKTRQIEVEGPGSDCNRQLSGSRGEVNSHPFGPFRARSVPGGDPKQNPGRSSRPTDRMRVSPLQY